MRLNRVLVLRREQRTNNSYRILRFESFVFTCLTYRNVQRFRNGPVHEFYGLKASQMSKIRASSHEYPHVENSRIFGNRISSTVAHNCLGKSINLTAKRMTSPCGKKKKTRGKKRNLTGKKKTQSKKKKTHSKISSIPRGQLILISFAVRSWLFFLP